MNAKANAKSRVDRVIHKKEVPTIHTHDQIWIPRVLVPIAIGIAYGVTMTLYWLAINVASWPIIIAASVSGTLTFLIPRVFKRNLIPQINMFSASALATSQLIAIIMFSQLDDFSTDDFKALYIAALVVMTFALLLIVYF